MNRKKKYFKFFYLIVLVVLSRSLSAQWTQLNDLSGPERDDGVVAIVNNKAYFGTGRLLSTNLGCDFYSMDLSSYTWSVVASMPAGNERQYASAFSYSNFVFVYGGVNDANTIFNVTYRYNTSTNTWTTVAPKPGTPVFAAFCFTIGSKAYIASGRTGPADTDLSNEVWEYDMATDVWSQKNNIPFLPQWRGSSASLNNSGYVFFGKDGNFRYHRELYKYDPVSDTWTKAADFTQTKRYYSNMASDGNRLIVCGGMDSLGIYYKETWFYDETNGFTAGPDIASARRSGMTCAIPGKFFYTCGLTPSGRLKETWMLDFPVGIEERYKNNRFMVYPNPFDDHITVSSEGNPENYRVELKNILGETIFSTEIKNEMHFSIDLPPIEKGIYFLSITSANGSNAVKKLVKE